LKEFPSPISNHPYTDHVYAQFSLKIIGITHRWTCEGPFIQYCVEKKIA
jgi:hypothetical protein